MSETNLEIYKKFDDKISSELADTRAAIRPILALDENTPVLFTIQLNDGCGIIYDSNKDMVLLNTSDDIRDAICIQAEQLPKTIKQIDNLRNT